jgi:histo-blood group ABO system transferase
MKIGLLIIATNKYTEFLQPLIESADKFFLKEHDVTYFVFTNNKVDIKTSRTVVFIDTEHKEWPWMTLGRYRIFSNNSIWFYDTDYLYYIDVDMLFVDNVGEEILGELVVTQHPGYYNGGDWRETRPQSMACIPLDKQIKYVAGGFNGGKTANFIKMANILANNIDTDYNNGIIAVWHDESHLNKYIAYYQSELKLLAPSYCYGEHMNLPFKKRIVALTKKHEEFRK